VLSVMGKVVVELFNCSVCGVCDEDENGIVGDGTGSGSREDGGGSLLSLSLVQFGHQPVA
jgi:hypothetical protein